MIEEERRITRHALLRELGAGVTGQTWHWFAYHLHMLPPHPFARSIVNAALDCEEKLPGLGHSLVADLGLIGGIDHHEPHYDQLMQKLAEILVLRQLLVLDWPEGTTFEHEPTAIAGGKRPELRVSAPGQTYLFEVKTPSLLAHARQREENGMQAAARILDRELVDQLAGAGGVTLPRDNPVKDFLIDSEAKFAPFKTQASAIAVLIIVWDDFIYEPITVLTQPQSGLLTAASYYRTPDDAPVIFPSIDAIIGVRHLTYFKRAAGDGSLVERAHAFDFGQEGDLPNVLIPIPGGQEVPELIRRGLRALPLDHPTVEIAAEYRPVELVFWM